MSDEDGLLGGPWNNGLLASSYVPLTDIETAIAPRVLTALERSRIAAYLASSGNDGTLRLYVASGERADARTVVAAVLRASGSDLPAEPVAESDADPLAGVDADAEFAAIVADWHVDTHEAIKDAERDLSREDEDWRLRLNPQETPESDELTWLDDDHYVPPNPPPIPRPSAPFVLGLLLVAVAIVLLAFGSELGLAFETRLFIAVVAILSATGVFVLRLRARRDDDDDGAIL
jgi:hypothetical protein